MDQQNPPTKTTSTEPGARLDGENLTLQERYEDALETILDLRLTVDTLNEELVHARNGEG